MNIRRLAWVAVTLSVCLGGWYLAHPETWNVRPLHLFQESTSNDSYPNSGSSVPPPMHSWLDREEERPRGNLSHIAPIVASCLRPPIQPRTRTTPAGIYRWKDDLGRIHFSDQPPSNGTAERYDPGLPLQKSWFGLQIEELGGSAGPFLRDRLGASITASFEVLAGLIGEEALREVQVNLKVFTDEEAYRAYAARVAGDNVGSFSGGFYSPASNEAVTYRHTDHDRTLAVARHESAHVMLRGMLGNPPIWLNEGLASYFERLELSGQLSRISLDNETLRVADDLLAGAHPTLLREFLNLDRETWYGGRRSVHYALAGSLVRFLMETPESRRVLAGLLLAQANSYCQAIDQESWFEANWPGGMASLQHGFRVWLRDPNKQAWHRF